MGVLPITERRRGRGQRNSIGEARSPRRPLGCAADDRRTTLNITRRDRSPDVGFPVQPLLACVHGCLILTLLAHCLAAGPFSDLYVFGDSLSDVGNVSQNAVGLLPGPAYFDGRFSNGPVFAEQLSIELGFGALTPSTAGGDGFAFGGAQTSGTGGFRGLFIDDIDEQVDEFVFRDAVEPDALAIVFAGANDLLNGHVDVRLPVDHLAADLHRLIDARVENFLVPNLPPLGRTPRFNGDPVQAATMNELTSEFNRALSVALDGVETSRTNVTIFRLDVAALVKEVMTDPEAFGLVNVTAPAAPGLEPGDPSYDASLIAGDPDRYFFWDDLHPTAAVHAILAEYALAAVVPEPSGILLLAISFLAIAGCRVRSAR